MKQQEVEQITNILINWENTHKVIPYFSDLVQHPVYGTVFSSLSIDRQKRRQRYGYHLLYHDFS